MTSGRIQAKHVSEDRFLDAMYTVMAETDRRAVAVVEVMDQLAIFPYKVVLAKARKLIRRGVIDGCYCGCSGGLTFPDADAAGWNLRYMYINPGPIQPYCSPSEIAWKDRAKVPFLKPAPAPNLSRPTFDVLFPEPNFVSLLKKELTEALHEAYFAEVSKIILWGDGSAPDYDEPIGDNITLGEN